MANRTTPPNQLDHAALPIAPTDIVTVSRNGTTLTQATVADLRAGAYPNVDIQENGTHVTNSQSLTTINVTGDGADLSVNGDSTQRFNVANATAATHAVALGQWTTVNGVTGYEVSPTGRITQWGFVSSLAQSASTSVSFPIAFPNACDLVIAQSANIGSPNGAAGWGWFVSSVTTSGFSLTNGVSVTSDYYWQARGR